jgi:hypothetical protein
LRTYHVRLPAILTLFEFAEEGKPTEMFECKKITVFVLKVGRLENNNATIKYFYPMGINYFYGHFEGRGNKGYFMPWYKNRKHQKLIYSTELGLNEIKNSFFGGNFD